MAWFIGQSLLFIGLAFLLGLLVGWLTWGRETSTAHIDDAATITSEPAAEPEPIPAAVAEAGQIPPADPVAQLRQIVMPRSVAAPEPIAEPEPVAEPEVVRPEPEPVAEPVAVPAVPVAADNLQRLEGIGPKISAVLIAAGIRTYADLAVTDQATLTDVLRAGGVRFAPSLVTWNAQAGLLAKGDEAGFAALTKELVANRRTR